MISSFYGWAHFYSIMTAVAAAASVPSSSTSQKHFYITFETKTDFWDNPEKFAFLENIVFTLNYVKISENS